MRYAVPNDDYKTFRKKAFFEMLGTEDYVDGATDFCLLLPFAKERDLSVEERLWLCILYGLSYSQTTTMRFFHEFPSFSKLNPKKLNEFWDDNKESLYFNPDKRHLKNNDQVIPAIKSIYKWCKGHLQQELQPLLEESFEATYKEIKKSWKYFGPHGAYLFFDAVYGLCPDLYKDPKQLDWKNCGRTVVDGMAHLLYQDEAVEIGNHNLERYNKIVDRIQEKSGRPKVIIESTLCAFRKLFKQTRYVGYYADRMLEECYLTEEYLEEIGVDVWKYRKATIPEQFLGELHDWKGIRKELCKLFMKTGKLTNF